MHEIIGHGSGTYDTNKYGKAEDPVSALGALGSALEEQRADLTALLFAGDSKLVAIGAIKDAGSGQALSRRDVRRLPGRFPATLFTRSKFCRDASARALVVHQQTVTRGSHSLGRTRWRQDDSGEPGAGGGRL